jgi:hypothetical protein
MKCLSQLSLSGLCAVAFAATAVADPGDLHEVSGAKVNLRAGPSDDASVLTTVEQGDELIELRREGNWLGVRVMDTGDEGWIYGELVRRVAQSRLERSTNPMSFGELSTDFERLIEQVGTQLGYPPIARLERQEEATLRVTPSRDWLLRADADAHLMAALALYQVWKTDQEGRPVKLVLVDGQGEAYVSIEDSDDGPQLTLRAPSG